MNLYKKLTDRFNYLKLDDENDTTDYFNKPCPEDDASIIQKFTYSWIQRMLWKGYFRGPLELSDISDLPNKIKVENSSRYLPSIQFNSKYALVKHTYTHYCSRHLIVPLIKAISVVFSIITPLILKYFIYYIQQENKSMLEGWGLSIGLFVCCFIMNVSQQYGYWYGMKVSLEIRGALMSFIFKKMLLLSNTARRNYNAGRILNLISVDVGAFQDFYWNIFVDIVLFPFQILLLLII